MKTSAAIEVRTSGHYSGNTYAERYRASKSPMRGKGNVGSKIEKTKEETYEQRVNLIEKLNSKNTDIDLFEKRTPSQENSVEELKRKIDKLVDQKMQLIAAITRETNQTAKTLFIEILAQTQEELKQIKKELKSKVLEKEKKQNEQQNK